MDRQEARDRPRPGEPEDLFPAGEASSVADQLGRLGQAQERLRSLIAAMLAISRDLDLDLVLRRIVRTAMGLVGARYGAMGVLSESGEGLAEFIPEGLSEQELDRLDGVHLPRGRGVLGELIRDPRPLRVDDVALHPASSGFPPGHPKMEGFLGVAITVQGRVYGNLYLACREDDKPFDVQDEEIVVALASAAAVAIENARLYEQVRSGSERFQRLLLPRLPDMCPYQAAAVYRPAAAPDQLGGDWYDAMVLPDGSCVAVIGDVCGHDLAAAASMSQTRSMLRALLYARPGPLGEVLAQLDDMLNQTGPSLVITALAARVEPDGPAWRLRWTNAGHPPPLLLVPGRPVRYLDDEPDLPLGVNPDRPRRDRTHRIPPGATVILFTDGLIEHRGRPIDHGLRALAAAAGDHAGLPTSALCRFLADHYPSDGHDDMAVMALRMPAR